MKRHYDHSSYKRKHFFGVAHVQFRWSFHYYHGGSWRHAGRHGAGVVAESPTSCRQQEVVWGARHSLNIYEISKPTPQWHTFSNKTTSTPTRPHLLIVPFPLGAIFLQTTTHSHVLHCVHWSHTNGPLVTSVHYVIHKVRFELAFTAYTYSVDFPYFW